MQGLEGVKVLELGHMVSAAYTTKLMADLGADVIKVEEPGGDHARRRGPFPEKRVDTEQSGLFLALNTNKRSVTLQLPVERLRVALRVPEHRRSASHGRRGWLGGRTGRGGARYRRADARDLAGCRRLRRTERPIRPLSSLRRNPRHVLRGPDDVCSVPVVAAGRASGEFRRERRRRFPAAGRADVRHQARRPDDLARI